MRGRFRRRTQDEADRGAALAARPGPPAEEPEEPPGPGTPGRKQGATCPVYNSDKVYLGVRVKMPVRDLLRNIRLSRGGPPLEAQERRMKGWRSGWSVSSNANACVNQHELVFTADKKRVHTRASRRRRALTRKEASQGLEELAFIVEVLEEDLRASSHPPQSPNWSPLGPAGSAGEELDEMIPSPGSSWTRSPGPPWCPVWAEPPGPDRSPDGSCFFWTQLQKEESVLAGVADAALLRTDGRGRTYLHQVACVGKRALGYCIAKRMAALHGLDLRDSAGMTALLYAAMHNHHLMVADLIRLGADVNAKNHSGKSCLHLSAEKGYVRVLEVLKQAMVNGVYVDVEAADNSGMSVLQCAAVALKAAVGDLEEGRRPRLHALRQEQMMETLECLLQMGGYLHTMRRRPLIS